MAKKGKDPAFLFYPQDFITGTYLMTDEQRGKYILLICLQHQKGHLTDKEMCRILNDTDVEVFDKFIQDEEGKWYNVRVDQEIEKRAKYSEYQSELAKRRWSKDAKASANNDAMAYAGKDAKDKPKESLRAENEDINVESCTTITSSPQTMFPIEDSTPVFNSLDDLYNDLPL